jgi:hypothetical protein
MQKIFAKKNQCEIIAKRICAKKNVFKKIRHRLKAKKKSCFRERKKKTFAKITALW